MTANYINFVTELVYGDAGAAELGLAPGGVKNHLNWTLDRLAAPPASPGNDFLDHHLDVMFARYELWRSKYNLPPVRPWDASDMFFAPMMATTGPAVPAALNGAPFPAGWTTNDLGNAIESHYIAVRNYSGSMGGTEMDDEIKALYSYRYWAFMKWGSDLRKRLLGLPVFPVAIIYDRDGTILSEREFANYFHQVHHVWHPNAGEPSWTQATPGFKTGVGQYRRKKQLSRTQIGEEFFAFHRDHLLLLDRWLAKTGQDPVQSFNTCGHDLAASTPPLNPPPAGLDVVMGGMGFPLVDYVTRTVDFTPPHESNWQGTAPGFDGTLKEFSSAGEMGQYLAMDFNPFGFIAVAGAAPGDSGYHGEGHVLNGDLYWPVANNFSPRFFAWHGFIDDVWTKRQPVFLEFAPVQADGSAFPSPQILTILREFSTSTDSVEPPNAIDGIDLTTGNGTVRIAINVRTDPFNRPLNLTLQCDVLREAGGPAPVISLPPRNLTITPGAPAGPNERQQNVVFIEDFLFDGSAGTVDVGGLGPFVSDNPAMVPTAVGFVNSLIRVTAYLSCDFKPDGSLPASAGTVSSAGTAVTGSGTAFTTLFREGDRISAAGQMHSVITVNSATSLTISEPFSPNLAAGTAYKRLEGFDAFQTIEIPLVQEKQAPSITAFLDHSSFSKDEVDAIASGGQSVFANAFYLLVQDRTARPAPIAWPSDPKTDLLLPQFYGIIAPPVHAAGLYPDLAHAPGVELRDAITDIPVADLSVTVTAASPEDPLLHPSVPQRTTYSCQVTFTGNAMFAGMVAGDTKDLKVRITATDRSGNRTIDDSSRVRLQINANPYMNDGPTSWLCVDTRVFQVRQGQTRFGVTMGADPNAFIAQVIDDLRAGNGTAGGDSFDALPQDQPGSALEYSTQVGGTNVYNFSLAKVRLQSVTGATGVRASFRLFMWGVANVSFDDTLAYRTDAASGIALLGRTTTNEVASVPFFAEPRVALAASMTTQPDPKNITDFAATGGVEALSFFGAYLDINQTTIRFPNTFINDGGFSGVPLADMRSIRDLLIGQHQCMIVEIVYAPDPTAAGATPGTSDNLSQRNLLILQTANPGSASTRAVQHSFNIDVTRKHRATPAEIHALAVHHDPNARREAAIDFPVPRLARPAGPKMDDAHHALHFFAAIDEDLFKKFEAESHVEASEDKRWQFDLDQWKDTYGLDELVFFWNNLPRESVVELFLPGVSAEEIINYRNLRHAPDTVKIVDSHTLRLIVAGPTYLPIAPFWGDNVAGLVTITLPPGIKERQKFLVDVVHIRTDSRRMLGGFQINIQVGKAKQLYEPEIRTLELFHQRLGLTPKASRWRPILERQVEFIRERARGFVELANEPGVLWQDPTELQKGQKLRLVLERIQILDDQDPCLKGQGEFRFRARTHSRNNGGISRETRFPEQGHYSISDKPGVNTLYLDLTLFEGFVEDHLAVEILGVELDTFDPDDQLCPYRRTFRGAPESWLGSFGPGDEQIEPEDLGDWRVWYRIERA